MSGALEKMCEINILTTSGDVWQLIGRVSQKVVISQYTTIAKLTSYLKIPCVGYILGSIEIGQVASNWDSV